MLVRHQDAPISEALVFGGTIYSAGTHPLIGMTYAPELALLDLIEVNDDIDRIEESFVTTRLDNAVWLQRIDKFVDYGVFMR